MLALFLTAFTMQPQDQKELREAKEEFNKPCKRRAVILNRIYCPKQAGSAAYGRGRKVQEGTAISKPDPARRFEGMQAY